MHDFSSFASVARRAELASSRRLAARTGMPMEDALRVTLEQAAGATGLAQMVAERSAQQAALAGRLAERERQKADALALRRARHDGPATPWRAWFDGSAHPNPGRCGIGAVLEGPAGERIEISQGAGYGNSSEAEYRALIALLRAALAAGASGLTVYGDSQGVIDDVTGVRVGAASLAGLRAKALELIAQIDGVSLRWVPRHKNPRADALSQKAVGMELASQHPDNRLPRLQGRRL